MTTDNQYNRRMRTVIESPLFRKQYPRFWSEDEHDSFFDWIARNPEAGDVIKNSGGMRKVRWARSGTGKSGGVRVIYGTMPDESLIMLMIYAKSERESIKPSEVKGWPL